MRNDYPKNQFSFSKLYCATFGHRFRTSKKITEFISEYQCANCKEEITINANGTLEKLTPRYRETNAFLAKIHERRNRRHLSEAS
ncbi:MAG TPA: hypothetical protein VFM70_05375 [Salinimicrobium sp.]|nr:hypothetical protein [Salinimicrobium sp.]